MKTQPHTQPNFEKIKVIIYNLAINDHNIMISLLGHNFKGFHKKKDEFKKQLNEWLDFQFDIRSVSMLKDEVIKKHLPKWYRDGRYIIDYNKHGFLDFIILRRDE